MGAWQLPLLLIPTTAATYTVASTGVRLFVHAKLFELLYTHTSPLQLRRGTTKPSQLILEGRRRRKRDEYQNLWTKKEGRGEARILESGIGDQKVIQKTPSTHDLCFD